MNRTRALRTGLVVLIVLGVAIWFRGGNLWFRGSNDSDCRSPPPPKLGPGVSRVDLGGRVHNVAVGQRGLWAIRQADVTRQSSQLVELDPATGRIKGAPIELPAVGWGLAVGKDAVWVVTSRATAHPVGILHKVDPETRRIAASFRVGRGTSSVSEGESGVWVANSADNTILRVDVVRRRVLTRARIEGGPSLVLARAGGVWVGTQFGSGALYRIDPATGRITGSFQGTLANVGAGGVWVVRNGPPNGQVLGIDPGTLRPAGPIRGLDVLPAAIGVADEQLWVGELFQFCIPNTARGTGALPALSTGWYRIDPRSLKAISGPIYVGENRNTPVFEAGAFWLKDEFGNGLIRIDLAEAAKVRP